MKCPHHFYKLVCSSHVLTLTLALATDLYAKNSNNTSHLNVSAYGQLDDITGAVLWLFLGLFLTVEPHTIEMSWLSINFNLNGWTIPWSEGPVLNIYLMLPRIRGSDLSHKVTLSCLCPSVKIHQQPTLGSSLLCHCFSFPWSTVFTACLPPALL